MPRQQQPALVHLRMSPHLRAALRDAADAAGCSLNAFAVQILATAAGNPATFRASVDAVVVEAEIKRDQRGYPIRPRDRDIHIAARNRFMIATEKELGASETFRLSKHYDANDPGYFVTWQRARDCRT